MGDYDVTDVGRESIGSDMPPILFVTFRQRETGGIIQIDNIFPGDNGSLDQYSMPTLG